jgi:uncharacterized protein (TIGR02246 family)
MKKVFERKQNLRQFASAVFLSVFSASVAGGAAFARSPATTEATLLDRIQIEEMIVSYYGELGSDRHEFGDYYVEDGVFVLNGLTYKGREAIETLYAGFDDVSDNMSRGRFHMLLTNLQVKVDGDMAIASMIWTGVMNEDLKGEPKLVEQGREYDTLVKRDGVWRFKERVVIADSALPDMFDESYQDYTPSSD